MVDPTTKSATVSMDEMQRFLSSYVDQGNSRRSSTVSTVNLTTSVTQALPVTEPANERSTSAGSSLGDNQGLTASCSHLIPIVCFKEGRIGTIAVQASYAFTPYED